MYDDAKHINVAEERLVLPVKSGWFIAQIDLSSQQMLTGAAYDAVNWNYLFNERRYI